METSRVTAARILTQLQALGLPLVVLEGKTKYFRYQGNRKELYQQEIFSRKQHRTLDNCYMLLYSVYYQSEQRADGQQRRGKRSKCDGGQHRKGLAEGRVQKKEEKGKG